MSTTSIMSTIRHIHYLTNTGGRNNYPGLHNLDMDATIESVLATCANDAREEEIAIEIEYLDGTTSTHKIILYIAAADVPAGEAAVFEAAGPAWPAKGGWTYQDIIGGRVILKETYDRKAAQDACDVWLAGPPSLDR